MEFSKVQNRFINQKSVGYQLLKGKRGTGKSTTCIYRAINLENNYCIYEEDKILVITSNYNKTNKALELYKSESNMDYFYSLFSLDKNRVKICTLEELLTTCYNGYKGEKGLNLSYINKENSIEIINNLDEEIKSFAKKSKFMLKATREFILDEILWIKACGFSKEEYLDVDRKGRINRVLKNSYTRECIYKLVELYNVELRNNGYMDEYDQVLFSSEYSKNHKLEYTHIIVDDCEKLTKSQIEFIKGLYSEKTHSSLIFIVNSELLSLKHSWLIKGRKLKTLGADFKGKTFAYKTIFNEKRSEVINTIENYEYINLRDKKMFEFNIDSSSNEKEIYLDETITFKEAELIDIPVFNNIAAGSPIEMNDNIEGIFNLPKQWIERGTKTFILTVQGYSMVEKNICDGDLIVIKSQSTASHNDIVAASLDGEATLKTLNMNESVPLLMPANPLYSPITLQDKEVSILGVAVGIIKNRNN